jgi:hypothetical protein
VSEVSVGRNSGVGIQDGRGQQPVRRPVSGVRLTGLAGVMILVGVTAVGALIDGIAGGGPGLILGLALVIGAVLAALLIPARLVWVVVPLPPLVFVVMAVAGGVVADRHAADSTTRLTAAAGGWAAEGFGAMATATLLTGLIAVVRMSRRRR